MVSDPCDPRLHTVHLFLCNLPPPLTAASAEKSRGWLIAKKKTRQVFWLLKVGLVPWLSQALKHWAGSKSWLKKKKITVPVCCYPTWQKYAIYTQTTNFHFSNKFKWSGLETSVLCWMDISNVTTMTKPFGEFILWQDIIFIGFRATSINRCYSSHCRFMSLWFSF